MGESKSKKSPAPMLFFSKRPEIRRDMANDYKDFEDEYMLGSGRLIEAAERGYRLDPRRYIPNGSFPPAVIEELLKAAGGFNPEAEFPKRSFPRAWPSTSTGLASPRRTWMIEAAERGYRLDPRRCLPGGSFPPAVIESLLKAAGGFNPEVAFPKGSFPRAWPFIGASCRHRHLAGACDLAPIW